MQQLSFKEFEAILKAEPGAAPGAPGAPATPAKLAPARIARVDEDQARRKARADARRRRLAARARFSEYPE